MNRPRTLATLLLAALSVAACSGSNPGASSGAATGATGSGGGGAASAFVDPTAPHAAPGVGTNPSATTSGGPPAPAGAVATTVNFSDPANMPFTDPLGDTDKFGGTFFQGSWAFNGGYLEQSTGAKQASLSFRVYDGNAFGSSDGSAPTHYRADVTAWVYQPSDQYPNMVGAPLGIIGYCPYFKDSTHYLLAVAKPAQLEVWAVDGFVPGSDWPKTNLLFSRTLATELTVGSPVAWSSEVDAGAHTATIFANGEQLAQVSHAIIGDGGQKVALISNGNYVHFENLQLFKL